eukprot:CAMPEP_0172416926 /NCGR_PEP_ID=MMETSP1064-20121228/3432_1 /TAXON_ID=202472 /ORGANISM="Aulacoseira subarctica , Strain CCAP 1002/5" /LENGTH=394 /DNA_ID=CAMNT_0013154911 /DNA_START=23 /DNA_END=1207 /DNA_ORIENTATION=-
MTPLSAILPFFFSLSLVLISYCEALQSDLVSTRRQWLTKQTIIGGALVTAGVATKIAIRGPDPFQPPPRSLENKVIVITGGNTGLGFESAKCLAKAGATVVITSRSLEKGKKAVDEIQRICKDANLENDKVYALPLDLCSLRSVREFATKFKNELGANTRIDVLLNNAGVMAIPKLEITEDGFEKTFQTNHLGHFALTAMLFPMLSKNGARVINVSSGAHFIAYRGLDLENLNGEKSYGPWTSYGASKLENILFTKELQRRVDASPGDMRNFKAFCLTPGSVRTDLFRFLGGGEEENFVSMMEKGTATSPSIRSVVSFKSLALLSHFSLFTKSVERGAVTQIWLAAGKEDDTLHGGEYLVNCKSSIVSPASRDAEKGKQLWQISEKMSGVPFQI